MLSFSPARVIGRMQREAGCDRCMWRDGTPVHQKMHSLYHHHRILGPWCRDGSHRWCWLFVWLKISPLSDCSGGSTPTLWHTSLINFTVMSLISLCLMNGNPPHGQLRVCSTIKAYSQTHFDGNLLGLQPYHKHKASWKSSWGKLKPCSTIGSVVSQLEASFSFGISTACFRGAGRADKRFANFSACVSLVRFLA